MTTPILGLDEISASQKSKYLTHNYGLRQIEALLTRALSATTTAQPGSPSDGDVYIMPATHTGTNWAGFSENDVALYLVNTWVNFTPAEGWRLWINDEDTLRIFDSSSWVDVLSNYPTINSQTGTTYTVQASDNNNVVTLNNASPIALTLPNGLTAGFSCLIVQLGAGQVTVSASTTLNSPGSANKFAYQYSMALALHIGSNIWLLGGDITT